MKAMILAAGRGERLRPLTDHTPKPLIEVNGESLVERHLKALKSAGIEDIIINLAWLGDKIEKTLGDGQAYGVKIRYSHETEGALETAGGIARALPMLGERFLVVNADIWTNFNFSTLMTEQEGLAHLVLVNNPEHNRQGDFSLKNGQLIPKQGDSSLTFSGIAKYRREFFSSLAEGKQALAPLLHEGVRQQQLTGEHFIGRWFDIGSPERLAKINQELAHS